MLTDEQAENFVFAWANEDVYLKALERLSAGEFALLNALILTSIERYTAKIKPANRAGIDTVAAIEKELVIGGVTEIPLVGVLAFILGLYTQSCDNRVFSALQKDILGKEMPH